MQIIYIKNKKENQSSPFRATGRTRTADPRITNALLYQLSHSGKNVSAFSQKRVQKYCFFLKLTNKFYNLE